MPGKSSESDSETSNGELALTEDEWEEDSEGFEASTTDPLTLTPEPLVKVEEEFRKYPQVPDDYPLTPVWLRPEEKNCRYPRLFLKIWYC